MAQITEAQRIQRIQELQAEVNKLPPQKHETVRVDLDAGPVFCDVISMPADEILLNPRSHRIRSQLEDDPRWAQLSKDPFGEEAQDLIEELVRAARTEEQLQQLTTSLKEEGQMEPGVMTHKGVLVNANTRAVIMRKFGKPSDRYLRVAVLPTTVQPQELGLLELRLQMQKELKVDYSLTNDLLFIEELATEYHMPYSDIAGELRIEQGNANKGAREVETRLKILDLLRQLQTIPQNKLPLRFFDRLAMQQLKEVHTAHALMLDRGDTQGAQRYLEVFLLSVLGGITAVHQIRLVDRGFLGEYVLPQLEDDEDLGQFVGEFVTAGGAPGTTTKGASVLLGSGESLDGDAADPRGLIDALTDKHGTLKVPGTPITIEREALIAATQMAFKQAIREKRRDIRASDKVEAPIEALRAATREAKRAQECLPAVDDPAFDVQHRRSLEAASRTFLRAVRSWQTAAIKAGVLKEK